MNEVILEYRRKLDSLTPDKKRIWVVAHTMMNEMTVSEEAGAQDRWVACKRHYEASKAAENELLELLAAPAQSTSRGRATRGRATKGETARSLSGRDRMSGSEVAKVLLLSVGLLVGLVVGHGIWCPLCNGQRSRKESKP